MRGRGTVVARAMSVGMSSPLNPAVIYSSYSHRGCWIVEHNSTVGMNSPQNSNVIPITAPDENNDGGAGGAVYQPCVTPRSYQVTRPLNEKKTSKSP